MTKKEKAMKEVEVASDRRVSSLLFYKIKPDVLKLPDLQELDDQLPKPRKKRELKWRKYLETRRVHIKGKRILIVETIVKNKETYSISGLTASELDKVREALK
jgi:hypothetical protein